MCLIKRVNYNFSILCTEYLIQSTNNMNYSTFTNTLEIKTSDYESKYDSTINLSFYIKDHV